MDIVQRGMLFAGKVMGAAALEFMQKDKLHKQVVEEFKTRRAAANYVSPIPDGIKLPLDA